MICDLCKKEINEKNERYVRVEDWDSLEIIKGFWMHPKCFDKGMNRDLTEMEQQAKGLLEKAGRILSSRGLTEMFPEVKEEYVLT